MTEMTEDEILQEAEKGLETIAHYISWVIEDSRGRRTSLTLERVSDGSLIGTTNDLQAILAGRIISMTSSTLSVVTPFVLPPTGTTVHAKARLKVYDSEFHSKLHTLELPAPDPAIFLASSGDGANVVDPDNVALLAFIARFEEGEDLYLAGHRSGAGLDTGIRVTRKSNRG